MLRAHQLETPECLWSRLPLPEVGCAASVSLQAQGRRFAEITVAVPISNRRCVLGNQTLTMLPLYLLKMSRLFFFFHIEGEKKSFKELHIQIVCVSKEYEGHYLQDVLQFASHFFFCHCQFSFNSWSRGVWKWNWKESCRFCFEKPFGKTTCFIPLCQHGSWQSCSFPRSQAPLQRFLEQPCYPTACFHYVPWFGWDLQGLWQQEFGQRAAV